MVNTTKKTPSAPRTKRYIFLPVQTEAENLGERISIARRRMRLTQQQAATKSQTSLSTYKRLEQGDTTVAIAVLMRVMHTFGLLDQCAKLCALEEDVSARKLHQSLPKRIRARKKAEEADEGAATGKTAGKAKDKRK